MRITKLGHCCLLIEEGGKRILTDPGSYTIDTHGALTDIDYILYTHEHSDHYHQDSLQALRQRNPQAAVYANTSVSALLATVEIPHTCVNDGDRVDLGGIAVVGRGIEHAEMHASIPHSANTGYLIGDRLWYPGDAFTDPGVAVEVLALPVAGPWMKISEAIDYALTLKPKIAFPVHDGIHFGSAHTLPAKLLPPAGIGFKILLGGESLEC